MEILTIGQKVRNRRKELNMTLKELAGDRVTAGQLSFVELGKSNPSGELLQYIADRLNVTVDYLLESELSQAHRVCEYNIRLAQAYIYDNQDEEADTLLYDTVNIANKYNLGVIKGSIELNRGKIALRKQLHQRAVECFLEANKLFIENNNYAGAVDTYILLGQVASSHGFHNLALSYFKQAEFLSREKEVLDEKLIAKIVFCIFMCCIKTGDSEKADIYLPIVEKYLYTTGDKKQYAKNLMEISMAYKDTHKYDKALLYTDKALDIYKEIEDEESLAKIEMNIGFIYSEKEDADKSNYYLINCENLKGLFNVSETCSIYLKISENYIKQKKYNDAAGYVEKSFKLAVENKDIDCQVECYKVLYKIYFESKNYSECESVLKSMLNLLETTDKPKELAECYIEIIKYYNLIGNNDLAIKYMHKGFERFEHIKDYFAV